MTSRPETRPATEADLIAFYGGKPTSTIKAVVVELNGEPIGIGGIEFYQGKQIAFCWVKPELKVFPLTIIRAAREFLKMSKGGPLIAFGDEEEPSSDRFLKHLGFTPAGEVYIHV